MKNKLFEIKNLNKKFNDGTLALNQVNLDIYEGITIIIGPSGSGKSTLLRTLNLMETPTSGEINYKNKTYSVNILISMNIVKKWVWCFNRLTCFHI